MRPLVGRVIVAIICISVVLPAPFGPSSPITPDFTSSERSRTPKLPARKRFETFSIVSTPDYGRVAFKRSRAYLKTMRERRRSRRNLNPVSRLTASHRQDDARFPVRSPAALEGAGVHDRSRAGAHPRDWRQHRGLQSRPHDVVRAAGVCAARGVGSDLFPGHEKPEIVSRVFLSDAERYSAAELSFLRGRGFQCRHGRTRVEEQYPAHVRVPRHSQLLRRARRGASDRALFYSR